MEATKTITDPEELKAYQDGDPRELIEVVVYPDGSICKHWRGFKFFPNLEIKEQGA